MARENEDVESRESKQWWQKCDQMLSLEHLDLDQGGPEGFNFTFNHTHDFKKDI